MNTSVMRTTASAPIWFLDTLAIIHAQAEPGGPDISIIEGLARNGDSPPLHVHAREDEAFVVLAGELQLRIDDSELRLGAGQCAMAPQGSVHSYRVQSDTARWLAITSGGDFAQMVRALGRPADRPDLPEPAGPPTPEQADALATAARQHHIELVGPPL